MKRTCAAYSSARSWASRWLAPDDPEAAGANSSLILIQHNTVTRR